jgi:hypothetical protein
MVLKIEERTNKAWVVCFWSLLLSVGLVLAL